MRTTALGAALLSATVIASPVISLAATPITSSPALQNLASKHFASDDSSLGISINLNGHRNERNSVALGVHLSRYPDLVVIPGYPVLYDPHLNANYFFYEGTFWVFEEDDWYRSDWYNGPWMRVERDEVPVFLLRIPVRYYNRAPLYFHPWALEMAPRWSLRWGNSWERRHRGWDRWDQRRAPPPAPPPVYQQQFPRERYPSSPDLQQRLHERHYRNHPREPLTGPTPPPPRQTPPSPPRQIAPPSIPPRVQPPLHAPSPQSPQKRDRRRQEAPATPPTNPNPPREEGHRERGDGRPRDDRTPGSPRGPGA